jgi:hypothetical protein
MRPMSKALLLALLVGSACQKAAPAPPPVIDGGPVCARAEDCEAGQVCDANTGRCGPCKSSGQCKPHQLCASAGRSQPLACTFAAGYGDACRLNGDCPAGQLCRQGLCLASSAVTSCPDQRCPGGQRCNRANLVCEDASGCFTDADCDPSQLCNGATHQCEQKCTASTADQLCAAGQKCVGGRCAQCGADTDCPGGLTCDVAAGRCTNGSTCFSDRDCPVPLVCNPATSQCTQVPPPCVSDEQCPTGQVCNVPSGRCNPIGCAADRYEPGNHTQATAAAIGPGPVIVLNDLTLCGGESDYFSLAMLQGDLIQVVVEGDPLASQTYLTEVLSPAGRVLGSGDLAANAQADTDGTFALRIHSSDLLQRYGLRVTVDHTASSCQNDAFEPNDTAGQATHVSPPGLSTLAICAGDRDLFSIDVPGGLGLEVSESADMTGGDLRLDLLAADGVTVLAAGPASGFNKRLFLGADAAGGKRIFARVQGGDPRSENQYSLAVAYRYEPPDAGSVDAGSADAGFPDGGGP